jgi:hypothetical protein
MEKTIVEQCVRQGMPLPERIQNAPELLMGLELFYGAFMDLTSCRGTGYGTEGPIPWTAVRQWAQVHGLDEEQAEDLEYYIAQMDETYLKFKTKKLTAQTKAPSSRPKGRK